MKLSQIAESLVDSSPLDKAPSSADQNTLAQSIGGDDGEINSQVKKQLSQKAEIAKRSDPKNNKDLKQTLQRLGSMKWDPRNPTFQRGAAKLLGAVK